jgi:prepilin-type N-terminal cleavage/methylation domain-containing protein
MFRSRHNDGSRRENGFTLLEVLIAAIVMCIGLLSAALLVTHMMTGAARSKDMSTAAILASEKLEDLNRWDNDDPHICVPSGNAAVGSLTTDIAQTTNCPEGMSARVNYHDDVYPHLTTGTSSCANATAGCFAETVSALDGANLVYTTTTHSPTGVVQVATAPAPPAGNAFHRRWVIEANSPVAGVRRVTVLVTELSGKPPIHFQMSIVRP